MGRNDGSGHGGPSQGNTRPEGYCSVGGPRGCTLKPTTELAQGTISFAESFLAGGVANYLGTYWPVSDEGAKEFAETFYTGLLQGETLGTALTKGRKAVLDKDLVGREERFAASG